MKKMGIKTWIALLLALGLVGVGCRKKSVDPFPPTGTVPGWQKSGNPRTFAAADLWQYLDGGADQYVNAGVVTASTSDYQFQGKLEAVVDVYTFKAADGARKIFDTEPTAKSQAAQLGDAARASGQSVVFRQGSYLVRITAYESAPYVAEALLALAHGVEGRL